VDCVFCGQRKPASEEDVIPKWIRRTLNITSEVIIRAEPTGATARTQHLRITLQDMVCETCNNTWMSRLENRGVKPFLEPMLTNKHDVNLDAAVQRDLARWAVTKVLLMEYAMRQRRAHLRPVAGYLPSEPELAWLYAHDDPPPRSRVWLGAFDAGNTTVVTTQSRLMISAPTSVGPQLPAHLTTLTIGYVLLQVFSTNFVLADEQAADEYGLNPPQPYAQALTRIWPAGQNSVPWPPSAYVSPEVLDKTANWGQPTDQAT
jgi:hypothetical protein